MWLQVHACVHYSAWTLKSCRIHGQSRFILHEAIACNVFNANYSAGGQWECQNDPEVLNLLMERLKLDFEGTALKMRKPWSQKETDPCL